MSSFPLDDFQEFGGRGPRPSLQSLPRRDASGGRTASLGRKRSASGEGSRRFFLNLIVILTGIVVLEIVFQFFLVPRIVITSVRINVSRNFPMSNEEIMEAAGLTGILYYYAINSADAALKLGRVPLVAQAEVIKDFPRTLTINIAPREPLAVSLGSDGEGDVPLVVDKEGVVFAIGGDDLGYLPILSGIRFPEIRRGMRLPEMVNPFLEQLARLRREAPALLGSISEFKFIKRNALDYDVLLYSRQYRLKVRIGGEITEDLLKSILLLLDATHREGINSFYTELDFRSVRVVYKTSEG